MSARASVIVCTHGEAPSLARTLDALARQRDAAPEIVLVTSGDPAHARAAVPAAAAARTTVVVEPAAGLNRKRNRGIAAAGGDLLLFTDDDCVPDPGWVAAAASALQRHPVVTGRVLPLGGEAGGSGRASLRGRATPRVFGRAWLDRVFAWAAGCGNNLAVRREVFTEHGAFCEEIGVGTWSGAACDTELFFRILCAGGRIYYEPAAVVRHEQPATAPALDAKRRRYYRGASYLARAVHPRNPAAWLMALSRLGGCGGQLVLAALTLRGAKARRHLGELRGALEGLRPPSAAPREAVLAPARQGAR